jgi:hypothetical protein
MASVGTMGIWYRCRNEGGGVGNGMVAYVWAVAHSVRMRVRRGSERQTKRSLEYVCAVVRSARTRGSRRETAAMCLAGGGACGRSPGTTSQTHAHANEVVAHLTDIPTHVFAMSLGRPTNGKGEGSKVTLGTVCSRHCRQRIDVRESGATWHKDVRRRKGSGGPLTIPIHNMLDNMYRLL